LLLNSLWGKFAQKADHTNIEYTRTPLQFHKLLKDPTLEIIDVCHLNENLDRVQTRKKTALQKAPYTNNIPVAAFVTSHARLFLFERFMEVDAVGGTLLYGDTDSALYAMPTNGPRIKEGNALGQMQRELPSRRIFEFVAGGPKNYAFAHSARDGTDVKYERKIRGFTLNYTASQQIPFEKIKEMVLKRYGLDNYRYF